MSASETTAAAHGGHHHDDENFHMPSPSIWPFIVCMGLIFVPIGLLLIGHKHPMWGVPIFLFGSLVAVGAGVGWVSAEIRDKAEMDPEQGKKDLTLAWKLFILSEAAIFGSFFGHYFYTRWMSEHWPPAGAPHEFDIVIPILGTVALVISSFTCEFSHKALIVGRRELSKNWLMLTMILGVIFLALQGYEWGYLRAYDGFTLSNNIFGTAFYMITGFHAVHVMTGLIMLILVYARLELGSFDRERHFSMVAASWYWHFVDVIWVGVLISIYLL